LWVDEEQHFGVVHKEKLKQLRAEVHVLTPHRDADPAHIAARIDRRARSLDHRVAAGRPAGRAYLLSPFDPLIVREALLRERYRGDKRSMSARASRTSREPRIFSTNTCRK